MRNNDRYTRLKAIKEFGYRINWEDLKEKSVAIIGIGGLGTVSSEMAARCGIGKLLLFDFDNVEQINLNRSMFKPEHIGKPKVEVAAKTLNEINPDVKVEYYKRDIMDLDFEAIFDKELSLIDLVLNGLDNIVAREYLNNKCISFRVPYIDAGASRSGLSGYVHPIIPYKTACAKCITGIPINIPDESGEPCVASLPSTMSILASIQVQEMLKYLLKFGVMIDYLMYEMISGKFHHYTTKRDENCPVCGHKYKGVKKVKARISKEDLNDIIEKME